jgi:hypothetical protein
MPNARQLLTIAAGGAAALVVRVVALSLCTFFKDERGTGGGATVVDDGGLAREGGEGGVREGEGRRGGWRDSGDEFSPFHPSTVQSVGRVNQEETVRVREGGGGDGRRGGQDTSEARGGQDAGGASVLYVPQSDFVSLP